MQRQTLINFRQSIVYVLALCDLIKSDLQNVMPQRNTNLPYLAAGQ